MSKVAGHEVNTKKSTAFLYTNNEQSEKEIIKCFISNSIKSRASFWSSAYFIRGCGSNPLSDPRILLYNNTHGTAKNKE